MIHCFGPVHYVMQIADISSLQVLLNKQQTHYLEPKEGWIRDCYLVHPNQSFSGISSTGSLGYNICRTELTVGTVWDSHCHLDLLARNFARVGISRGNIIRKSLQSNGQGLEDKFGGCVANFCDPWDWTQGARGDKVSSLIDECQADDRVFLTLGCHPHFADKLNEPAIDQLMLCFSS